MQLFGPSAKEKMIDNLLNIKSNQLLFENLTALQNEISVGFDTKVVAVTSVKSDSLTAAFAKGFADVFALNQSKTLIIDANMYNPLLEKLLIESETDETKDVKIGNGYSLNKLSEGVFTIFLTKQVYPSALFKSGFIQRIVNEQLGFFEHIVIITPSIKEHKEIVLLKDVVQSIILISQRNVTVKKHIYEACAFLAEEKLPLAKTVVLK